MRKTIALHVLYKSLYISCRPLQKKNVKWPSSAYSEERERGRLIFRISISNWTLSLDIKSENVFRAIGELNRSRKSRISLVKYKFIFGWAWSSASPLSLLKMNLTDWYNSRKYVSLAAVISIHLALFALKNINFPVWLGKGQSSSRSKT